MIQNLIKCGFCSFIIFITPFAYGATGVGNGGDVVDRFLASIRVTLLQSALKIKQESDTSQLCSCTQENPDLLCQSLQHLTMEQQNFCRDFILETLDQVISLNHKQPITPFELSDKPLYVPDPYGKPRRVSAMTELGPEGGIRFHYESIKILSPMTLLALMSHEFGHKVFFKGALVEDNPAIGPFNFLDGGRALLDSVGAAVALYAAEKRLVGKEFGIDDRFSCKVRNLENGTGLSSSGISPRLFLEPTNFDFYEAGLGRFPRDFTCGMDEFFNRSSLEVRLNVHEEIGCGDNPTSGERWTKMELWRVYTPQLGQETPEPQKLQDQFLPNFNPLCGETPSAPMIIEYLVGNARLRFEVRYELSYGRVH